MANNAGQNSKANSPDNDDELGRQTTWKPSGPEDRQEFFLPVSGFVWFYPEEMRVIDHPAFQRLSKINQLGQAYQVFRGATHKRLEHVLGAVDVVQQMINAIAVNAGKAVAKKQADRRDKLSLIEERFVRLGALLHDIGHLASGHTLEDELCLFGKHDEDERLDLVFNEVDWGTGAQTERLAAVIDRAYGHYMPEDLRKGGLTPTDVIRLLIRKKPKDAKGDYDGKADRFSKQQLTLSRSASIRLDVCTNLIGNTLCADLLDYIHRDWYHVGKPFEREDRIYQYMEIRNPKRIAISDDAQESHRRDHSDFFVLNLGYNIGHSPKIRTDGITAILSLLEKRYELAETVLYHKTKLAAGAMLGRALFELWSGSDARRLPKILLNLSDEQLIDHALDHATEITAKESGERKNSADAAIYLLSKLKSRSLYRSFHTIRHWDLPAGQKTKLTTQFAPKGDYSGSGAANRNAAARELEQDFELPRGSIVISLTDVKAKIAEVQILVNNEINTFAGYEKRMVEEDKRGLSGGHLEAQVQRFSDLWRCDFFIAKDVLAELEEKAPNKLQLLRAVIKELYVSPSLDATDTDLAMERFAQSYVMQENRMGRNNIQLRPPHLVAARGVEGTGADAGQPHYPGGARAIRSFWITDGSK